MQTTRNQYVSLGRVVVHGVALGAIVLGVSGCVADTSPRGYYGANHTTTSTTTTYYNPAPGATVVAPAGSTVVIQDDRNGYTDDTIHDYDNHWDYGRRGNGNFHGTGDDDVHED